MIDGSRVRVARPSGSQSSVTATIYLASICLKVRFGVQEGEWPPTLNG